MWGGQLWPQPPFRRPSRLKAGCDKDAIFHTVYDLAHLRLGYKNNGIGGKWRGIYDKGRRMVAISYNSDLGDTPALQKLTRNPLILRVQG